MCKKLYTFFNTQLIAISIAAEQLKYQIYRKLVKCPERAKGNIFVVSLI